MIKKEAVPRKAVLPKLWWVMSGQNYMRGHLPLRDLPESVTGVHRPERRRVNKKPPGRAGETIKGAYMST